MTETASSQSLGYFRPGYYPIKTNTIIPAMIWLSDTTYRKDPDIDFVFVKPSCYLHEWQDALSVSEQDFDEAMAGCETLNEGAEKISSLITHLTKKGYLPLQKLKDNFQLKELH